MFGTNPIAFAAPANQERGFVLDMATTVVTRGKIEVYDRLEKPLPSGWAVDKTGRAATDARVILDDMFHRAGGGIMPLGGEGELFSGYKGYGLAIMVDILCALLCGAPFGPAIADTATSSGRVSHFLGAMCIDRFRDPTQFRRDMDRLLQDLRDCPPAEAALADSTNCSISTIMATDIAPMTDVMNASTSSAAISVWPRRRRSDQGPAIPFGLISRSAPRRAT
jgi:LDH2 family malate/lactate/ureidoglycolate dehydrogenase